MAEQTIDIPGVGPVSFPAEMSDADIATAAGRLHGDAQAAAAQARLTAEPEGGGVERAIKGFARTNPLTGLYNLLTTNPWTTLKGIGQSHLDEGAKTIDAIKRLVVDRDPLALSEAVGHGVATLTPLVGPAAAHAGELIGSGDIAGGLGETTGLLMGVPSVGGRVVQGAGRVASKVAPLVKTPAKWGSGAALFHGNPVAAAATYAVPLLLEYGGRALERVGAGIRESAPGPTLSLRRLLGQEPVVVDPYAPNVSGYRRGAPASDVAVGAVESAVAVDPYAPNEPGYTGPSSSDVSVGAPYEQTPGFDRYAANRPGYGGPGSRGTTRFEGAQDFQPSPPIVDPYAPNVSGYRPGAPASDVGVGAPYDPVIDPYAPNISGYDQAAPASDLAVGEPYVSPATEILSQRTGAPRAVARPLNLTENLQTRVAEGAAPEVTPEIPEEGWITPGETLQSIGVEQSPTAGRGFWKGLRRGDLWPQLQEDMLASAETPPPSQTTTLKAKATGRTGPGVQGKGGRFAPKASAAPAADVAPATAPAVAPEHLTNRAEELISKAGRTGLTKAEAGELETISQQLDDVWDANWNTDYERLKGELNRAATAPRK